MTEKISFHRLAEQELTEAAQYYDSERQGLGAAFLDEIERCVRFILSNPRAAPILIGFAKVSHRVSHRRDDGSN